MFDLQKGLHRWTKNWTDGRKGSGDARAHHNDCTADAEPHDSGERDEEHIFVNICGLFSFTRGPTVLDTQSVKTKSLKDFKGKETQREKNEEIPDILEPIQLKCLLEAD